MNKKKAASPVIGASSLIVIFAVLCLVVFALLSLTSAQAESRLSAASQEAVRAYYEADRLANERFAQLRADSSVQSGVYSYVCPISETQELQVSLRCDGGAWTVLRWQAVSTADWESSDELDVWPGDSQPE